MEPMALGSAPSSPNTSLSSPLTNPNFLPAFLMGETQTSTPRSGNLSPTRNRTISFKSPTSSTERNVQQRLISHTPQDTVFNLSAVNEKVGPPARGLFDTIDAKNDYITSMHPTQLNFMSPIRGTDPKQVFSPQQQNNSLSRNLNESLNKSALKKNPESKESHWITVLGFPPHAASLVLTQFAQCGNIIDKKFPPEGNWVHLKYSSKHEVAKALSYSGKLISKSIMVGVIPCYRAENKENSYYDNVLSPNRARSLVQSYVPRQNSNEVVSPQNVPQRSNGFVTKAMEYVFGW